MEVTYRFMEGSDFTPLSIVAWLPDALVFHYFNETPNEVKQGIEAAFFDGNSINDYEDGSVEIMNALIINSLIGLQKDMRDECGENDWIGMINAYDMPQAIESGFRVLAELHDSELGGMTESEFNEAMGTEIN